MKKFYFYSTLSFILVSFLIETLMSSQAGFTTFAGFNWFINPKILSLSNVITWLLQGLALSFAASLYMQRASALVDGVRFGMITGWLFVLLILFNMMLQIDHSHYPFLADSLLPLISLQLLGFVVSGWLLGLMYEIFSPMFPTNQSLWSLA